MKTLTIREVKNGYIVERTDCGKDFEDHKREEFVLKELPADVMKLLNGEIKGSKQQRNDEYRDESFGKAEEEAMEAAEDESEKE